MKRLPSVLSPRLASVTGALAGLAAIAAAPSAHALSFDAAGDVVFDPKALVAEGFEGFEATAQLQLVSDQTALQGNDHLLVSTQGQYARISIKPKILSGKHAYRARVFARTNRLFADIDVTYPADGLAPSYSASMFPSGRVTSDGWYEIVSSVFSIDGDRASDVQLSVSASGADMDAFELVEEGAYVERAACEGKADAACGASQYCASGFCRDGDATVPPLPPQADRDALVSHLQQRFRFFFGGRYTRENRLPIAIATMESMRTAETAWAFWNGFATAIHQLHDWHTKTTGNADVAGRGTFPVCVVEGDADLSHDLAPKTPGYPDVLVSHVGPTNTTLKPGDRIASIDGMHPLAWVESLEAVDWGSWRSDDPEGHAEAAERLRSTVTRWAKELTIIRCDATTKKCTQEILATKDLPKTMGGGGGGIQCDHRPRYHLGSAGPSEANHQVFKVYQGVLVDSQPGEDLYGMVWNDVYLEPGQPNPYKAPLDTFRANAKGLVLDHRTGNGGTEPAAEFLTTLFRESEGGGAIAASSGFIGTVDWLGPPFSIDDGVAIYEKRAKTDDAFKIGGKDPRLDLRTALLLARDGSASDWFPYGVKGAPNVRIFGRRTAGAFSSFLQFDYFNGLSWQFASGDLIRKDGTTHLGEGVLPDEELLPKQSDLLIGKDTVYERALEWIRSGKPAQGGAQ